MTRVPTEAPLGSGRASRTHAPFCGAVGPREVNMRSRIARFLGGVLFVVLGGYYLFTGRKAGTLKAIRSRGQAHGRQERSARREVVSTWPRTLSCAPPGGASCGPTPRSSGRPPLNASVDRYHFLVDDPMVLCQHELCTSKSSEKSRMSKRSRLGHRFER